MQGNSLPHYQLKSPSCTLIILPPNFSSSRSFRGSPMIINCFLCRMRAASSIVRFLVLLSAASALDPTPRVAGGSQAIDGDFSYFGKLRIQLSNGLYTSCGGTLISPTAVLVRNTTRACIHAFIPYVQSPKINW